MKYILFVIFFLTSLISNNITFSAVELKDLKINIVTAEYPPYNFTKENKITGISTEIIIEVLKEMNLEKDIHIKVYPWARAYQMALKIPNTFIFSLGRTTERENFFKWVEEIVVFESCIWKAKSNKKVQITQLSDLKKYRIGTQREEYIEQYLKKHGFESNIDDSTHPVLSIKKLLAGRIDVFAYEKYVTKYVSKNEGINFDDLEIAYNIAELDIHAYLACSKETPDFIVEKFREALKKIKKDGRYEKIIKKWFK
jgi:polar amino acid transport system substrate-binding protein